jgi:chemotaxis-related protein WspD
VSNPDSPTIRPDPDTSLIASDGVTEVSGCWGSKGVYGDGSCNELSTVVHCRNCPVYSAAGVTLIDRPLPANYRREWTQHFAREKSGLDSGTASVILFRVHNDWLAMPTHNFQEVAERRPIHSLPRRREPALLGLANVRGELVICVSLGHLLQLGSLPSVDVVRRGYQRLLVLQGEANRLGFPVDEVHGPQRVKPQELQVAPSSGTRATVRFVQAFITWEGRSAGLLDPQLLFSTLQGTLA